MTSSIRCCLTLSLGLFFTSEWPAALFAGKTPDDKPFVQKAQIAASVSRPTGVDGSPSDVFSLLPGFQVETLFIVPKEILGSWVNITSDPKGRLIVSDQHQFGLCRVTPPATGSSEPTRVERLNIRFIDEKEPDQAKKVKLVTAAQGLLWAFDSLYVVCNGGPGSGIYRCRDTDGDDQFDKVELLREIPGTGEHGPHAIRLSPDGKSLYLAAGNFTKMPFPIKTNAPPQTMGGQRTEQLRASLPEGVSSRMMPNWDEDLLLPRLWDGFGHAIGILAPGGWICRTDPDGKVWEVFSSGYRNQFDFAFNADGEMFVYDADMERDFGSPWYRPTRVVHATSGSEFGWRSGTGKWPRYYVDSLPEVINIGPGSPVGVEFGYGARFPAKYQKALFIADWTYGTIYAIHIEPSGSSYKATKEEFLSRTPLPLTDCIVGKDGALYFVTGGSGLQSALYRVSYVGNENTMPVDAHDTSDSPEGRARKARHRIEEYHFGEHDAGEVVRGLTNREYDDRHIRYAARIALERFPVEQWQDRFADMASHAAPYSANFAREAWLITACVGLARQGEPATLSRILTTLESIDFTKLPEEHQLGLLRAYQLALIRLGNPDQTTSAALAKKFDDLFPQESDFVNRELSILMIHFQSPGAVRKLVPLLAQERVSSQELNGELLSRNKEYGGTLAAALANQPDQMQYHYAFHLRNLKAGWTLGDRKAYFSWFMKARTWTGGSSYPFFLTNIDNDAFANCTDSERLAIEALGIRKPFVIAELPKAKGPGQDYSVEGLLAMADRLNARDFKNGENMYKAARCVVCHRFGGDGGATGPDLTLLAGRFSLKDVCEAIIDPSKVIADQYKASVIEMKAGKVIIGQIVSESTNSITVVVDPENATKTLEVRKSDIEASQRSTTSLMPKDLLKQLNPDEVLDLLAYLLSRGDPGHAMFKK